MKTIQFLALVVALPLAGTLLAQEPQIWLDSRVAPLPTDQLGPRGIWLTTMQLTTMQGNVRVRLLEQNFVE